MTKEDFIEGMLTNSAAVLAIINRKELIYALNMAYDRGYAQGSLDQVAKYHDNLEKAQRHGK